MSETERQWRPVPPTLRTFTYDGTNAADCIDWVNQFPGGVSGTGGADWTLGNAFPAVTELIRVVSLAATEFGPGTTFDWPQGWVCSTLDGQSFALPREFSAATTGYEEITP